jgi:hypothetical protein
MLIFSLRGKFNRIHSSPSFSLGHVQTNKRELEEITGGLPRSAEGSLNQPKVCPQARLNASQRFRKTGLA